MASTDLVMNTIQDVIGRGTLLSLGAVCIIHAFHFMYISASGIRKLDAYFENGKDYDDTWSTAAACRFFDYVNQFILGKLKVKSHGMRWWMYWNAMGSIAFYLFLMMFFSAIIYLWLFV